MTSALHVEPEAEREVAEAAEWYEAHEAGLGASFVAAFRKTLTRIVAAPESFAAVRDIDIDPPARSAAMNPYPYRIVFVPSGDGLRVIAVMHVARDWTKLTRRVGRPPTP